MQTFKKILVANRGEIAIRIFRAATELGLRTVGLYSYEDRHSIHRYKADEAWMIGEEGHPLQAYLDIEAILGIAKDRQVDAIHPGYGFLSENASFARRCAEEGIVFVGPPADVIDSLGDKLAARAIAVAANVPVIPGTDAPLPDVDAAITWANTHGYPVMLKALFGGGGRGMRRAHHEAELREAFSAAQREATAAFGRGDLFLEKLVVRPRHIEVQMLGDRAGNIVHLFERDCSVQRRNQKVVEVAPAVGISDDMREGLYADALRVARQAGLVNAATVEFLVAEDESWYFIEVNPRLQVEHTITELITGIDIVQAQFRIAEGQLLSSDKINIREQADIRRRGSAIQARITTENPANDFAPDTGRVTVYRSAAGFGIRLDAGIAGSGSEITPHYDSMLVKVSAWALDHQSAAQKLARSLMEFRIRGVATNIPFLENIIRHKAFLAGQVDTTFVSRTKDLFQFPRRRNRANRMALAIANTIVNGPPGVERHLARPAVLMNPVVPDTLPPGGPAESPKSILDQRGPEALATWVRESERLLLTDTTFRDAHQSLIATRMRTHDMLRVAPATEARLRDTFSVECWGGATFDVAFRFLREDPWERLSLLREAMPNTLLQMLLRGSNAVGYTNYPENVVRRFVQLAAQTGVDVFRIFDCFNQSSAMAASIDEVRAAGKIAEVSICFTGDLHDESRPLYTLDYYRRKAAEFAAAGAHMLAIKDMAGLLRPSQARELIAAIRQEVDLPVHLHTHDTAGNGVATLLAACEAGVDVVDCASASMSGLTSQPSMDALMAALSDSPRCPRLDTQELQELSDYWEGVRTWYAPFESGLMASTADVYRHEIPGGQYSNLKPQALAVGLAEQWPAIRERYREVNFAFGDIIKVTPSSKVVGDFALWLVRNDLTVKELLQSEKTYDVPRSVVDFFSGALGVPEGGFPAALRSRVLGADAPPPATEPASAHLPPFDFDAAVEELEAITHREITDTLAVSYALYPKVIKDYLAYCDLYGNTSVLDTETFLYGLDTEREIFIDIEPGKRLVVEVTAVGEPRADFTREVHFMINGQPRVSVVDDRSLGGDKPDRRKADPQRPGEIGAPMPGNVLEVSVAAGDAVKEGDALGVVEAMKLETTVRAPHDGVVAEVLATAGDRVQGGDLIFVVEM
jgi:pyruvate carboxylase